MSKELFDLVKSMGKEEKRNFKLMASQVEGKLGNSYSYLFDIINKSLVYDENLISDRFSSKFTEKIYNHTKHYLKKRLIESLLIMSKSEHGQISETIHYHIESSRILFQKGITHHAIKEMEKAELLAKDSESWDDLRKIYLLQINNHKRHYIYDQKTIDLDFFTKHLSNLRQFELYTEERFKLCTLLEKINFLNSEKTVHDPLQGIELASAADEIMPINTKYHLFLYFNIHAKIELYLGNEEKFLEKCTMAFANITATKLLLNYYQSFLELSLDYIKISAKRENWAMAQDAIDKILFLEKLLMVNKIISADNQEFKMYKVTAHYLLYLRKKEYHKLFELNDEILELFERPTTVFSDTMLVDLMYGAAYAAFSIGNFKVSIYNLEALIRDTRFNNNFNDLTLQNIYALLLMNYYELGNFAEILALQPIIKKKIKKSLDEYKLLHHFCKLTTRLAKIAGRNTNISVEYNFFMNYYHRNPEHRYLLNIEQWIELIILKRKTKKNKTATLISSSN